MADLPPPGRKCDVQPANLGRWQSLKAVQGVPVIHEPAALARHVRPQPSPLAVAAEVEPGNRNIGQKHRAGMPEPQPPLGVVPKVKMPAQVAKHGP